MRVTPKIAASVVAAALMSPALAAAAPAPAGTGLEIGARIGYGVAGGSLGAPPNGTDNDVGNFVSGQVPLWLDAGYRFTDAFYLGGFFQYGFGTVNQDQQNGCRNANVDCGASDTRLGVMGRYRLPPIMPAEPWLGLGIGYEWGTFSVHQSIVGSTNTDSTWSGIEIANLQAGADFRVAQKIAIGPFVSFSLGQFQSTSTTTTNGNTTTTTDQDLAKKSLHEWFLIGARFAFMP
ncbi:MAG TPA: autotransporter domain-containing protein [Polyangia bacterium]|nr:autotransporter domain-containing protein [Polyangia bacterium]